MTGERALPLLCVLVHGAFFLLMYLQGPHFIALRRITLSIDLFDIALIARTRMCVCLCVSFCLSLHMCVYLSICVCVCVHVGTVLLRT